MSADANSAYGKPWFQRGPLQSEAQSALEPNSFPIKTTSSDSHQLPHQPTESNPNTRPGTALMAGGAGVLAQEWNEAQGGMAPQGMAALVAQAQQRIQQTLTDQVTPLRLASHLSVLLVAAAVLLFSRIELPEWDLQLAAMPTVQAPQSTAAGSAAAIEGLFSADSASALAMQTAEGVQMDPSLADPPQIVPFAIIQERSRQAIETYTVQQGDTVLAIAARYKLQPETIQWSNPKIEQNPDLLRVGDELKVLPLDGVLHTVSAGDTLSAIAQRYKVSVEEMLAYDGNNLADINAPLIIGTSLVIPGGTKPQYAQQQVASLTSGARTAAARADAAIGSGNFSWPASGSISQNYWGGHPAIDIAGRTGSPVRAADGGYVTTAGGGWNGGYGNHVIVDHGNGFATLYAHLNSIFVSPGENVVAGQQVGTLGNTGNSTGPHLHFEIRYQGYARNPYNYLP